MGTKIAGIQSFHHCDPDADFDFSFSRSKSLTTETKVTATKTFHWNVGASLSVSKTVGIEAGLEGIAKAKSEISIGFTMSTEFGQSTTQSTENTKSLTEYVSSSAKLSGRSPKAGRKIWQILILRDSKHPTR